MDSTEMPKRLQAATCSSRQWGSESSCNNRRQGSSPSERTSQANSKAPLSSLSAAIRRTPCPSRVSHLRPPCSCLPLRVLRIRSEEHTSELQSPDHLVCRLLLEK